MAGLATNGLTSPPRVAVLAAVLALVACADPRGDDVGRRHPIVIEQHAATLTVAATPSSRRINAMTTKVLDEFFDGYIEDGGGGMRITTPPGAATGKRSAMAIAIRDRAVRRGINVSDVELLPAKSGPGATRTYRLRYLRHSVRSPRCGHWSKWVPFNPHNRVHPNYGCASQSYLGRMASRPTDLVTARRAGPRDTTRSNAIIENYRKGEPTAAKESADEKSIRTLTIK